MTFHTLILIGNLGRDPEMRYTPSGQPVTSFSVASNRSYTGADGQKVDETIWFRVTAWGKLAETCNQYLTKGSKVLVEGRLVPDKNGGPRIWTRQDGTPGASFEVTANTVRFLSGRGDGGNGDLTMEGAGDPGDNDEIPF
jgi:single-strand DNA-binding protein